ncbi:MAG: type IX secretion system membrane protein PorP/SprF [Bacteroidetes bacterium]|nr:type IX secretion system membrane protein PorP/SprF [Bacteroidota bacterium]HET6244440.1 type IX secretion system membrane protein PorP/SprF [Bacteroidia bacterium]
MRQTVFFIFIIIFGLEFLHAQQTRQYTQYMFNQFGHNPAVAGSKECIDIRTGYRLQWLGFEGAPKIGYFSFQTRIKNKKKMPSQPYHGVGFYLEKDQIGPFTKTYIYPAYAYHIPLNNYYTLSAGAFAGLQQFVFDNNVTLFNPVDNAVAGSQSILVLPDFTAGLWLYSKNTYAGLAAGQIYNKRIKGPGGQIGNDSKIARHYVFSAGHKLIINREYSLIPSTMVKFIPMAPPAIDLNLIWDYKNVFSLGFSLRNRDALAALIRLKLLPFLDMGYSFDYTTSKIRTASSNTHEIMIGVYLCGRKGKQNGTLCPAYH